MSGSIPKKSRGTASTAPGPEAVRVRLWRAGGDEVEDLVAAEEPLEIRVHGLPYAVTLRTPGHDDELARGFLFAEGVLADAGDLAAIERLDDLPEESRPNVLDVRLVRPLTGAAPAAPRLVTSACGLCGRQALESLSRRAAPLPPGPRLPGALVASLPVLLQAVQTGFAATGGLHGAALFDEAGRLLVAREDVGRHNAVDKVVGWALASGLLPLSRTALAVSGRAGFEIAQKAWLAGVPILVAVSAPSSLSVALARQAGMTLVGFTRGGGYNVYSAPERVLEPGLGGAPEADLP